jgi:hypothetical protein
MPIPNWIVSIEDKTVRERVLSLWADFQRARERAQLDYQQVVQKADGIVSDAAVKRDGVVRKAREVYNRDRKVLLEPLVEKAH